MSGTATHPLDDEARIDDTVEDSFPASDPPSNTPATDAGEAKGTPHSDRQASETAAGRQEGGGPAEHKSE